MVSRIVNQSLGVVQRFPYLGMFPSVVRWQFFVDLPDLIDGFRGSVSGSLQLGICTVVVVVVSAIVAARESWVCISAGLGLPAAPGPLGHVEELAEPHGRHARLHADHLEVFEAPSRPSDDLFHTLTSKICLAQRLGQLGALGL